MKKLIGFPRECTVRGGFSRNLTVGEHREILEIREVASRMQRKVGHVHAGTLGKANARRTRMVFGSVYIQFDLVSNIWLVHQVADFDSCASSARHQLNREPRQHHG
jgi:1,2-phenylacetyl-CoA epoxidase PaaB subunit